MCRQSIDCAAVQLSTVESGVLATLCLTGAEGTDGRGAVYTQRVPPEPYLEEKNAEDYI